MIISHQVSCGVCLMKIIEKDVHRWIIKESMMKVEDDCIFVVKKISGGNVFVVEKMTSKDKTLCKIEEMSIALLIVHDVSELLISVECSLDECEQLFFIIVERVHTLKKLIFVFVEDERCSKCEMFDDDELKSLMKLSD